MNKDQKSLAPDVPLTIEIDEEKSVSIMKSTLPSNMASISQFFRLTFPR